MAGAWGKAPATILNPQPDKVNFRIGCGMGNGCEQVVLRARTLLDLRENRGNTTKGEHRDMIRIMVLEVCVHMVANI